MLYLTLPCLAMKHLSARINDSVYWVCNFNIHCSTCKAWKHCTISLQFLPALFFDKWTKHIHSQYVKGGRKPLKLLQITHLLTALLVTLFPHIIQKPEFPNWLSVTPLLKNSWLQNWQSILFLAHHTDNSHPFDFRIIIGVNFWNFCWRRPFMCVFPK